MNRQRMFTFVGLVLGVLLLTMPLYLNKPYYINRMAQILIGGIFALSLWIIMSVGEVSFSQAGFMAIGAYTVALLGVRTSVSFWLALPAAGIVSAALAFPLGFVGLRRVRGVYFFIFTLALGESIRLALLYWKGFTGGVNGIPAIPRPELFGIRFAEVAFYYLCLAVLLITFSIIYRIWHSRVGDLIRAVRSSEKLANAFGISAFKYRMIAWLLGCFFAGITGGLTASLIGFTNPNEFLVVKGMYPLIHVIIGGLSNPFGPLIGTGFMMIISTIAKDIVGIPYWGEPLMYGLVLLIVLVGLRISIWEFLTGR